jgi:hypothetical protein
MASMRRFHQLTGPNNKRVNWALGSSIQYYFTDLPIKSVICGKKYVSAVQGVMLTYALKLRNTSTTVITVATRDEIMRSLISQIQVDGSSLGTLISAAHMKPGIIDTVDFVANGGRNEAAVFSAIDILPYTAPSDRRAVEFQVFLPFGYYGCKAPYSMAPMTSWIRPANLKVDAPSVTPTDLGYTIEDCTVTASATLIWRDEIVLPPGFQMTRFKSTATQGTGSDTIDLKSFGQNSTLTGVEQRAAIAGLLWASSKVQGDGTGAGLVENITDFSALFAGIEQTNDITPIVNELRAEYEREASLLIPELTVGAASAAIPPAGRYPLFDVAGNPDPNITDAKMANYARFLPVFPPRKGGQISKMPVADGSPSYQLTGTFTNSDHYSYMFGLYRWQTAQADALIALLQRDDIGAFLYGGNSPAPNDLTDTLKLSKKNPDPINISKSEFMPRKLLPKSMVPNE